AAPITAYALGAVSGTQDTRVSAHAPLVGRDEELATLLGVVADGGQVVDIAGPVGTGKSRLLEELRDAVDGEVRVVTCEQYERTTPYFAFGVLLRTLLGLGLGSSGDAAADADALAAAVIRLEPSLERWLPLVGDVVGIAVPDTPVTARLDPRYRRERIAYVVTDLLTAALPGRAVVAFDDVHWLDGASAEILLHLASAIEGRPWTVCVTRRPDAAETTAPPGAVEISLGRLDAAASRALVAAAGADSPLPPHVANAVLERAEGNPLFLEELVRMARRGSTDELPDSLEAVVAAQIDGLEPGDRRLLRHAAVLGDSFEPELFAEVVADAALRASRVAATRLHGFVQVTRDGRLRFRHRLVRDVAYQALPFRQRQVLHARAAQVIERTAGPSTDERAGVLSLHCFHAQQFEKCWTYARVAAERAHAKWAMDEACELYERAIAAARRCPDTVTRRELADAWASLAKARQLVGRYEHADAAYRALRRLSGDDRVGMAAVCARHAQIAERLGRATSSARWVKKGLRLLDGVQGRQAAFERAHLLTMHATAFYRKGDLRAALRWCEEAIEMARIGRNSHARAEANVLIDSVKTATGAPDMGTYARKALALYERLELRDSAAMVLNNLGAVAYWQGRWTEALALYDRARATFEEMGDVVDAALSVGNVAEIFADQGRLDEADAMLREVVDVWRSLRFPLGLALATRYLARVTLRRGDHDGAIALFDEAREVFASYGQTARLVEVDTWLAECFLHRGDVDRAGALLADVLAQEISSSSSEMRSMIHRLRACAAASAGRLEDAWAEIDQSLAAARQRGASYDVALALEVLSAVSELGGLQQDDAARRERATILASLGVEAPPAPPLHAQTR
ncbi:MAG TPA: tetratricopeptide repeat protein, partial [Acidimicrobiales bacterium]